MPSLKGLIHWQMLLTLYLTEPALMWLGDMASMLNIADIAMASSLYLLKLLYVIFNVVID